MASPPSWEELFGGGGTRFLDRQKRLLLGINARHRVQSEGGSSTEILSSAPVGGSRSVPPAADVVIEELMGHEMPKSGDWVAAAVAVGEVCWLSAAGLLAN